MTGGVRLRRTPAHRRVRLRRRTWGGSPGGGIETIPHGSKPTGYLCIVHPAGTHTSGGRITEDPCGPKRVDCFSNSGSWPLNAGAERRAATSLRRGRSMSTGHPHGGEEIGTPGTGRSWCVTVVWRVRISYAPRGVFPLASHIRPGLEKGSRPRAGVMYGLKSVDERNDDKVPT